MTAVLEKTDVILCYLLYCKLAEEAHYSPPRCLSLNETSQRELASTSAQPELATTVNPAIWLFFCVFV